MAFQNIFDLAISLYKTNRKNLFQIQVRVDVSGMML